MWPEALLHLTDSLPYWRSNVDKANQGGRDDQLPEVVLQLQRQTVGAQHSGNARR